MKSGLVAGEHYSPIFEVGRRYQWMVRGGMQTIQGQALGRDYCHEFQVSAPVQSPFAPLDGRPLPVQPSIRVATDRMFDALSVRSHLVVTDEAGQPIPAHFSPSPEGNAIIIDLLEPSKARRLTLRAHERLEDVAGNRAAAAFEEGQSPH